MDRANILTLRTGTKTHQISVAGFPETASPDEKEMVTKLLKKMQQIVESKKQ